MPSATIETPILIVGGGPVGLALAADLGWRGAPCLVIEQGEGPADHPRATAINARSMEFMRRWGVADAVRNASAPPDFPHTALYCTTLTGFEIARIERPHHGGDQPSTTSPERAQRCNQIWLDPILRDLATSFASVDLRYRWRFEEVRDEGDRVIATVHDLAHDERRQIAAQYVIDCSGGHSAIRRQLGLTMSGSPYIGHFLSIFVRAPALWEHHAMGKAALINFVEPDGLWRNLVMLDGRELYRFGVRGKEFYDAPDKVDAERLFTEVVGKQVPHEIISVRRWIARNVVADRYRSGRIFLAGDAAHLNHPSSGLGLNTGLGDAVDLGWKLSATLAGWGGGALLDSYEIERQPVGRRNIGHADVSHASDREREPAAADLSGHARRRTGAPQDGRGNRRQHDPEIHHRRSGARLPLRPLADLLERGRRRAPRLDRGLSPQRDHRQPRAARLARRRTVRSIDLFGRGFTLLRFGDAAPEVSAIERGFAARGVPLTVETNRRSSNRRAL